MEQKKMVNRLLDCNASDLLQYNSSELKASIKASEGRTIMSENVVIHEPLVPNITNSEIAKASGADLLLLNQFDVLNPIILGLFDGETTLSTAVVHQKAVYKLRRLTGRPIGTNLEPISKKRLMSTREPLVSGRIASPETFCAAEKLGLDFVLLTGNPGVGTSNCSITQSIKIAKENYSGLVMAGKMHSAGVDESVIDLETVRKFIEAGADVILVPAIGTIPSFTDTQLISIVKYAHEHDVLVSSAIGTSQEGTTPSIIESLAIRNKVCGVDIQHIGDSGYAGVAPVENIFTLSKAIRGQRHTISMIARSILR